jgi:WW domain-containing oxidoreductase
MWFFGWKGPSGFSASSRAEEVTQGIDGTGLTAIVTGFTFLFLAKPNTLP